MAKDIRLPELGENITAATVIEVLVKPGETIRRDQPLLALESDKAEFELPSPVEGTVAEVLVAAGDQIEVGQVILRVDGALEDKDAAGRKAATSASAEGAARATEASEGRAARPPQQPPQAQPAATPNERAAREPAQSAAGAPSAGGAAGRTVSGAGAVRQAEHVAAPKADKQATAEATAPAVAAPSVRRLARELGVDVDAVARLAAGGRVTAEDVYRYVRRRLATVEGGTPHVAGARDFSRWGDTELEPMSTVRRRTAEQMSLAWSSIPHVSHHDAADITELDRLRRQFAPRVERAGGKLTVTAVVLKVLGSALRRYPKFNASVDMEASAIVYKKSVNIGVAVDTERGLIVPVIRDVDEKNIVEIALELREVSEGARGRKLTPDRLQGATFTVTNLGGIGGRHFDPLINPPEVAVLGVSRSRMEAVWTGERFEPRLILPLSLCYDHRIIDGADAARFLRWVCEALEEPFLMDLEGQ